jgi:hypothetical protein
LSIKRNDIEMLLGVAWIPEFGVDIVADKIKKGRELGIVAFGETVQVG